MSEIRKARTILLLLLLSAAVLPTAGCRTLVREAFKPPKVKFVDVAISSKALANPRESLDAVLHLSVDNPNPYAVDVSYVAYSAFIGTEMVANGEHREGIRIEASTTTIVQVPVRLLPEGLFCAARNVLAARAIRYEFNGSVGVNAPLAGVVRIPFSKIGSVDPLDILRKKGIELN